MAVNLLRFSVDGDGLLVVRPVARGRCVSLRLRPDGIEAFSSGLAPAVLPWAANGGIKWAMDGRPVDAWGVTHWASGRSGVFGIAIQVSGAYEVAAHDLIVGTSTRWRRYHRFFESGMLTGHALPVVPRTATPGWCTRERATLWALAAVLSRRSELRARLAEPQRMAALAAELTVGMIKPPVDRTGALRRDTLDIVIALSRLGYHYEFGRPLSHAEIPDLDEAVARVRTRLDANPFRAGRKTDDAKVRAVVRRAYFDVEPWPFSALVT